MNRKKLIIIITALIILLSIVLIISNKINNKTEDSTSNITFKDMNLDSVNKVYIKSLYRGYDDYIFDEEEIATIIDFLKSIKGTNKHSSKGYSGGVYSVALYDEGKCLLSIGFGSSNDFNYGENDKDKGYPNRYLLEGHTTDEIIVFFNQYVLLVD